jgi:hypothetical protein
LPSNNLSAIWHGLACLFLVALILWLLFDVTAVKSKVFDLATAAWQAAEFRDAMKTLRRELSSDNLSVIVE